MTQATSASCVRYFCRALETAIGESPGPRDPEPDVRLPHLRLSCLLCAGQLLLERGLRRGQLGLWCDMTVCWRRRERLGDGEAWVDNGLDSESVM